MSDLTFVLPGLGRNGGVRTLTEWITRYSGLGVKCAVVTYALGPGAQWVPKGVPIYAPSTLYGPALRVARRLARTSGHDALDLTLGAWAARQALPARHGRLILGLAALAGAFEDVPHTLYAQHWEPLMWPEGSRAASLADRGMRSGEAIITNSSWLRTHLDPTDRRAAFMVHPGVDRTAYPPRSRPRAARTLRIAALGREDAWKGLRDLREALALLDRSVDLYLFGTSRAGTRHDKGFTEFRLGGLSTQELADLYASVDVLVTPSWYESFPLPPLEAMSVGCPVVTTPFGTEDYAVDGVNALVVPPQSSSRLAAALERLSTEPEQSATLVAAGFETADRFSWTAGFRQLRDALGL